MEKLDDGSLGLRLMKIIEPPQLIAEDLSYEGYLIDINEGELVRDQGEIFRVAIDSEGIRELRDLT